MNKMMRVWVNGVIHCESMSHHVDSIVNELELDGLEVLDETWGEHDVHLSVNCID